MSQLRLALIVFLSGACVMMLELCGSRVLAPMIGSSIFVWTSLIGAILAALSIGYWKGGIEADKNPTFARLSVILAVASALVALIVLINTQLLIALFRLQLDPRLSAVTAAAILFGPASVALGMVPPFAFRLAVQSVESAGRSIGMLTACSTLGSIAGTFLMGFYLIAKIGTMYMLVGISGILCVTALIAHLSHRWYAKAGLGVMLVFISTMVTGYAKALEAQGSHDIDTEYQRIFVLDVKNMEGSKIVRVLSTGPEGSQSVIDPQRPLDVLAEYLNIFELAILQHPQARKALLIGGGGYAFPNLVQHSYPAIALDVVELDPGITEVAKKYFFFEESPQIQTINEDARVFLNRRILLPELGQEKYDIAFVDAYNSSANIPFHLTTKEFLAGLSAALSENGVVALNVIGTVEGPRNCMVRHMAAAVRKFFPDVRVYRATPYVDVKQLQNIVIIARRGTQQPFPDDGPQEKYNRLIGHRLETTWQEPAVEFTDDFAPSEHSMVFGCE